MMRTGARRLVFAAVQAIALLSWGIAQAVTVDATHSVGGDTYPFAGGTVDIAVNLSQSGSGSLLSLGLSETIPSGWTFNSVVSGPAPLVTPNAGAIGTLEFAWGTVPALPATFVYRLNLPAGDTTARAIWGQVLFVDNLGQDMQSSVPSILLQSDNPVAMPLQAWPVALGLLLAGIVFIRFRKHPSPRDC